MRSFAGWIVVRTILVADVVLLVVAGFMALIWVEHPAGILAAAAINGAGMPANAGDGPALVAAVQHRDREVVHA